MTVYSGGVSGNMQEESRRNSRNGEAVSAQEGSNGSGHWDEKAPTAGCKHDDEKKVAEVKTEESSQGGWKDEDITFPDGGFRAWMVVAGAMCCTFST